MLELFKKLKTLNFEGAIEYCCCEYEGDVKMDIDTNTKTIILSNKNVTLKVDYDWNGNYYTTYSTEEMDGTVKVEID